VESTFSLELWKRHLIIFAYRVKIADTPAHSLVSSGELLLTSD